MAIYYDEDAKVFTLQTRHSTYQSGIGKYGYLLHLYYGAKVEGEDMSYLIYKDDRGFSGNPYEAYMEEEQAFLAGVKPDAIRSYSMDTYPQEYSTFGSGDFRSSCLAVRFADGSQTTELRYRSHRIYRGKYALPGLPAMWGDETEWDTLEITLQDPYSGLETVLLYGVLEAYDIITRAACIVNRSTEPVDLERALSMCLEHPDANLDFISFYGRHNMERQLHRCPLRHGRQSVGSVRGTSSHHYNPFIILCEPGANEDYGGCYGMSFVYSGNFLAEIELDQINQTRCVMGIHPEGFCWRLDPEESFTAPEVVLSYSPAGLTALSQNYHQAYRSHLIASRWSRERRPVLINNWEATKFDFNDQKLLAIAREAKDLGIEMLVMDDGWFGNRDYDRRGLGDWFVNEKKFSNGLTALIDSVNELGMKFGIWVEPEMVNEDSELFRKHPDWCLGAPWRKGVYSRGQRVLDLSRTEVRDYLFDAIGAVLDSGNIEYVKWDMNRSLTDVWSAKLTPERQGEAGHRYVLGLYELMERFKQKYPNILFESCSGGGGRFDAGMLYYMPQIWCSDNTDAIDRIRIQYGTSFGYPINAVGAHVSVVPNQQTGRVTPLAARGAVAMAGTFGYELDITQMTDAEKQCVKEQVADFKRYYEVIQYGRYYRLTDPEERKDIAAWSFVSEDQARALIFVVVLHAQANAPALRFKAKGLQPDRIYSVSGLNLQVSGAALMHGGLVLPKKKGDYISFTFEVEAT